MAMMRKKYMKQVGHADAQMFYYVDSGKKLAKRIGGNAKILADESYYSDIPKKDLLLSTKVCMAVSDRLRMVKMIHLRI